MGIATWCPALAVCGLFLRATIGAAQTSIPLCTGLTIVGAVSEPEGDYEPMVTVTGIDEGGIHLKYYTEVRTPSGSVRKVNVLRTVRPADLNEGALLMSWFDPRASVVIPGATAIVHPGPSCVPSRSRGRPSLDSSTGEAARCRPSTTCSRMSTTTR